MTQTQTPVVIVRKHETKSPPRYHTSLGCSMVCHYWPDYTLVDAPPPRLQGVLKVRHDLAHVRARGQVMSEVMVLWDEGRDRPRGKTHALDCYMLDGLRWAIKSAYCKVDVAAIPDSVGRCGFCGGGRPVPKTHPVRPGR